MEDNVVKLDLNQPPQAEVPTEQPAPEAHQVEEQAAEPKKVETPRNEAGDYVINLNQPENAVQVEETESVPVQPEASNSEEVVEEVREQGPVLELVEEEKPQEEVIEAKVEEPVLEEIKPEQENQVVIDDPMPEGINKFIEFMNDTGLEGQAAFQAYADLNKNVDEMDARTLMTEYYKATKPFLNDDQIQKQLNKKYTYDPENTDADVIEEKNIALQEELYKAKQFMGDRKEKYLADLKLRQQKSLPPEAQEAVEFYSNYKSNQEKLTQQSTTIQKQIDQVYNEEFKGFDFKVGDSKYRFRVNDPGAQKENHKDWNKVFGDFFQEDGSLGDAVGYNKALFAAKNADKLAQHFYEQGRADAIKESARKSKNIDMGERQDNSAVTTPSGQTVRVVSGNSKQTFKSPMKIPGWNN